MARSEPPMNTGMVLPGVWLGIAKAPMYGFSFGLPAFGSSAYPNCQPGPLNEAAWPCENGVVGNGLASSVDLLARESARNVFLNAFRPAIARGWSSVPFHLPPAEVAICPP